ncbi:hypothetical protein FHS00_002605 [Limimaricola variabilis]|uniref:Uncharacterized protein n=1 Tax=Limimaricola variabilis TaxID=1492771 RepID=A0ABR6HR25_9RHOB|nr:hypothetical protein [Limimaricola variabilis]MBB3713004.1 hypothetical protein [Limimaricola variabilis]
MSRSPMPLPEVIRSPETIAARRRGSFNAKTEIHVVVAPDAITPAVFMRFPEIRFAASAREIERVDMREGRMSLGELYDALT